MAIRNDTRSSRSLPPVYASSLVFSRGRKCRDQLFCMLSDGSNHSRSVPEMRRMYCMRSCYGWLLLRSYYSDECHLFNPWTLSKINLPNLVDRSYNIGLLTSSPSDPHCIIVFFSENRKSCIYCRIGDTKWIEQNIESRKKSNITIKRYNTAVSANGKVYLFFYRGLAIIEIKDESFSIEPYVMEIPELSIPRIIHSWSDFVESCGEIYFIKFICLEVSRVVQKLDIFKLNASTMTWEKVSSLGNKIFLLGENSSYGTSVSASELGIEGNRVIFFVSCWSTLYSFNMEDESITALGSCHTQISEWGGRFWVVPNCTPQVKKEVAQLEKTENEVNDEQINGRDIPKELLEQILQSLSLSDYFRFRLTCKFWKSITLPVRSVLPKTTSDTQHLPWFLYLPGNKKGICSFSHPIYTDSYMMNIPQLESAIVRHAKFGWFFMSEGDSIFFFNPCTMDIIKVPDNNLGYTFVSISFTSPPTSADCVVCGERGWHRGSVTISVYRKGDDSWHTHEFDVSYDFLPSACNPVFFNGIFYYLAKDGKLGIFNPNETKEEDMWRIISKVFVPEANTLSFCGLYESSPRTYLMECDGEIFSAFVDFMGSPVRVYKLDQSKELMEWVIVESLGDRVMFLSHTTSILTPAGLKGTENRIYFPRFPCFKGSESLFYSLRSRRYNSFARTNSREDWTDSWGHWNCTWFQTSD